MNKIMEMEDTTLLLTNFSSEASARSVARILMQEQIITSVNIFAPQYSLYPWEGAVREQYETAAIFKTFTQNKDRLAKRLSDLHPYDLPSIISLKSNANADYVAWLRNPNGYMSQEK